MDEQRPEVRVIMPRVAVSIPVPIPASISELRDILGHNPAPRRFSVKRTFDGSIDLRVLSDAFTGFDDGDRIEWVEQKLALAERTLPPRTLTFLKAPDELDSDDENALFPLIEPIGVPTWGDALLREPAMERPSDDRNFGCKVVAFWGLKGGVGRSTALAHVASLLGRRKNILTLDLDLDSPGLVATLAEDATAGAYPRFENLLHLAGDHGADGELERQISLALRRGKDPNARVHVLGPAAADSEFVLALLGPLAPSSLYRGGQPALRRFVRAAIRVAEADVLLIDTRSGYCDESAMTALDLADEVVFFASPAPSTFVSIEPAIYALERNRRALGRPRQVHLVAGMMPAGVDTRQRIVEELQATVVENARERIFKDLGTGPNELPPDIEILTIDYSARIVENEGRLMPTAVDGYRELAERILPANMQVPDVAQADAWVKAVLQEAQIPVAQAEHEEDFQKLAELFTSTRNLQDFVRHEVCLVLGAKGTGKSYLRRMCLGHKELVVRRSRSHALDSIEFVDGYSQPSAGAGSSSTVTPDLLKELKAGSAHQWSLIWSCLALGKVLAKLNKSGIDTSEITAGKQGTDFAKLANAKTALETLQSTQKLVQRPLELDDVWTKVDLLCAQWGKTITLLFDDLDIALGDGKEVKATRPMIRGLLDRTNTSWVSRRHLGAKVFLREDIFRNLGIEEEAKYATRRVVLKWSQQEIWRLVIRTMAVASPQFAERLQSMGINREQLEESAEDQWSEALELIWGERLGEREAQTRSTAWVWTRLHDGQQRMFPRAALWLLKFAIDQRRASGIDGKLPLLDAASLRAAIPLVAKERLAELRRECTTEQKKRLGYLKGFDSYQNENKFLKALKDAGDSDPKAALDELKMLGIVESGSRRDGTGTVRIVDLYALASELKIVRRGRR